MCVHFVVVVAVMEEVDSWGGAQFLMKRDLEKIAVQGKLVVMGQGDAHHRMVLADFRKQFKPYGCVRDMGCDPSTFGAIVRCGDDVLLTEGDVCLHPSSLSDGTHYSAWVVMGRDGFHAVEWVAEHKFMQHGKGNLARIMLQYASCALRPDNYVQVQGRVYKNNNDYAQGNEMKGVPSLSDLVEDKVMVWLSVEAKFPGEH